MLMKYHMKPKGTRNSQGFRQHLYGYDLVLYPYGLREQFRDMT